MEYISIAIPGILPGAFPSVGAIQTAELEWLESASRRWLNTKLAASQRPMANDDDDITPVGAVFSAMEDAASNVDQDEPSDPQPPRDAWWLRWLKYMSIIAVPAILLGLGFLVEDYFQQYYADSHAHRVMAQRHVEHETIGAMKIRFWLGAGIGGGLGMIYVVRCMVRKVDP